MRIRRCGVLLIEPREALNFSLQSLLDGGDGLTCSNPLIALAPHLEREIEISAADVAVLAAVPATHWIELENFVEVHPADVVERLVERGLLLSDAIDTRGLRARDEQLREMHWWTPAAISHYFGKWNKVSAAEGSRQQGFRSMLELTQTLGPPPPHVVERTRAELRLPLPRRQPNDFDDLLDRRVTCRNFDTGLALRQEDFACLLERVFAARAQVRVRDDTVVLKRSSPSGGGLHPIDCYVLVQAVTGVAPGIYHYHPIEHALEPLQLIDGAHLRSIALSALAGQEYWAEAQVQLVMVARFARHFWKYRNHSKAYRVVLLDAGHLSQTLYLAATEAGLGAFVTGAINETEIEALLGLDPLTDGVLAMCGFGLRAAQRVSPEFDPIGAIWPTQAAAVIAQHASGD